MAFTGFSAEGIDLLQLNRLQNNKEFYEANKEEIKALGIQPFHDLIEAMTPTMLEIDPLFVTIPSRMVSRVRRDTRYTTDKTLYRANLWMYFRRQREYPHESMPFYYVEVGPESWGYGCWGCFGKGEMAEVREMILHEDKLFQEAKKALDGCPAFSLAGDLFKRPKHPGAKAEYQPWLNRKNLGADYTETDDFAPVLDGTFLASMLEGFRKLTPFYRLLVAAKERAEAAPREAVR
ncbi:DUF2461 domain-containing protein [Agathobaculum sp.]|uniref:DUF2461 domain-containing protein n=1 Tax=Agathobaculum sp. TaxID=2048138 RepID=UPI002A7FD9AF|nr:DUF2461 domain-containing protein [Agathobaculum sp.]MDY3618678.1 DUF2461 domain-containing protein [Agathobaculum sp.]